MILELKEKLFDYLKLKVENFKVGQAGQVTTCTCPACGEAGSCILMPFQHSLKCNKCNSNLGTIIEIVRIVEPDKLLYEDDEIIEYLADMFSLKSVRSDGRINTVLEYYDNQGFDCVQIQRNGKIPIEKEWTTRTHRDIAEWHEWISTPTNIGVKTGAVSNITVLDIDHLEIPEKVKALLSDYKGLLQQTNKGYHYFYKYVPELGKKSFDFEGVHFDIENDKGQVVVFPSVVNDVYREFSCMEEIPEMPQAVKDFLIENGGQRNGTQPDNLAEPTFSDMPENFSFVQEGNRNNFLVKFGGILRKDLNLDQTRNVLDLVNSKFINPPIPQRELWNIVGSIDKYIKFDEKDLANKILNYLKIVGDATGRDVKEVCNETKEKVDKTLAFLVKEGYVIKQRRMFHYIKKPDWRDTFENSEQRVSFTVPYFNDIAHFNYGDMVLLGSRTKWGKTTISMNMIQSFVRQGIKPYYISLETGSRFIRTAKVLEMKEGDFYWTFEADPAKIELEPNAVTIIDWLMIEDKSMTDSVLKHFVEQLFKTNGFLIIFMQLKETDGDWFAPNMVKQFPALAARYFYTGDDGIDGNWLVDVIREAKSQGKSSKIPCRYEWSSRELLRLEDWEKKYGKKGVVNV